MNICVTNDHWYVPLVVSISRSFSHSRLITGFVTRQTQEVFSGVRVTRSYVFGVCFLARCLSFCTFSFDHCVVCSSSIYGFWLPLWYLQNLLCWPSFVLVSLVLVTVFSVLEILKDSTLVSPNFIVQWKAKVKKMLYCHLGTYEFIPWFVWGSYCSKLSMKYLIDHYFFCCPFSSDHCVVCSSKTSCYTFDIFNVCFTMKNKSNQWLHCHLGTDFPSGAPEFTTAVSVVHLSQSLGFSVVFC